MGRTESHQAAEQGMGQSAQDQANAQKALAATNSDLTQYSNNLNNFMKFGRQTYGANGEYMRDQNTIANTTAKAGATSIAGSLAQNAMKTGQNTAGYATALGRAQNQAEQGMTNQLANADANRLQQLTNVNQFGVQASALPAQVESSLYGTGTSGSGSQLSSATNAAKTPGFWDTFLPALAQGAGTAIGGACPMEGALIRMGDGTHKKVEELRKGEWLTAPGINPPNELLETPQPVEAECWEIVTQSGLRHCGSDTHTIALASGGYAYMPEMKSKVVVNEFTGDLVLEARPIGKAKVYPIKLGGNHAYWADGIWILA